MNKCKICQMPAQADELCPGCAELIEVYANSIKAMENCRQLISSNMSAYGALDRERATIHTTILSRAKAKRDDRKLALWLACYVDELVHGK